MNVRNMMMILFLGISAKQEHATAALIGTDVHFLLLHAICAIKIIRGLWLVDLRSRHSVPIKEEELLNEKG